MLLRREGVGGVLGIGRRRKRNGNEMERKHLPTFLSYFFAGGKKAVPPKVGTTKKSTEEQNPSFPHCCNEIPPPRSAAAPGSKEAEGDLTLAAASAAAAAATAEAAAGNGEELLRGRSGEQEPRPPSPPRADEAWRRESLPPARNLVSIVTFFKSSPIHKARTSKNSTSIFNFLAAYARFVSLQSFQQKNRHFCTKARSKN